MVRVEFLANQLTTVKTTVDTETVRFVYLTTMFASRLGVQFSFPVGPAMTLFRVSNTLLRNWHGKYLNSDLRITMGFYNNMRRLSILTKKQSSYKSEGPRFFKKTRPSQKAEGYSPLKPFYFLNYWYPIHIEKKTERRLFIFL